MIGTRTIKARSEQELIIEQGNVEFVAGALNLDNTSLSVDSAQASADGTTPITITVEARDMFNNPISGKTVLFQATGNASVTQPATPTDSQGQTSGTIVDTVAETVTITATVDGTECRRM